MLHQGQAVGLALQGRQQSRSGVPGSGGRGWGRASGAGCQAQQSFQRQGTAVGSQAGHELLHRAGPGELGRHAQPGPQNFSLGREQYSPLAQAPQGLLEGGTGRLIELIDLGDVEGLLEHAATGGNQHQIVVDQGSGDRHRRSAHQGATATDQPHASVAADLQVGAGQAAGLPEALQETAGPIGIAAAQGKEPAVGGSPWLVGQQGQAQFRAEPGGQLGGIVQPRRSEGAIPQPGYGIGRLAALPARGNGPGIALGPLPIGEQVETEGCLAGHKAGRPRRYQGLVLQLQRRALQHQPPTSCRQAQQQQHRRQHDRQKRAGLHASHAGWAHLDPKPRLLPAMESSETPKTVRARELQLRLEQGEAIQLVDVREDAELELARLAHPVLHLPLSRSAEWVDRLGELLSHDRPIVVLCHAGVRSWQLGCWLIQAQGYGAVWNLQGGIDSWSLEVDSSVPRY